MADIYTYVKRRNEIGKPPNFADSKQIMLISMLPDPEAEMMMDGKEIKHVQRNPNQLVLSNFPILTESIVNTERVSTVNSGMLHVEGGWPKEVDSTDINDKKKYIKKRLEKNADNHDKFTPAVKKMLDIVESILAENNQIDMYEEYFEDEEPEHNIENVNVKTLKIFKNSEDSGKRAVTSISWHPDGPFKLAASYAVMKFQGQNSGCRSYIWDINNPNVPSESIEPPSPIVKLAYNHKAVEQIAFGCYNGIVGLWDSRMNTSKPAMLSPIEISHHEPISDLRWLSSKGGNEFVSSSSDGQIIWWDFRDLSKHSDSLIVSELQPVNGKYEKIVGCTALEYVADYGVN